MAFYEVPKPSQAYLLVSYRPLDNRGIEAAATHGGDAAGETQGAAVRRITLLVDSDRSITLHFPLFLLVAPKRIVKALMFPKKILVMSQSKHMEMPIAIHLLI